MPYEGPECAELLWKAKSGLKTEEKMTLESSKGAPCVLIGEDAYVYEEKSGKNCCRPMRHLSSSENGLNVALAYNRTIL